MKSIWDIEITITCRKYLIAVVHRRKKLHGFVSKSRSTWIVILDRIIHLLKMEHGKADGMDGIIETESNSDEEKLLSTNIYSKRSKIEWFTQTTHSLTSFLMMLPALLRLWENQCLKFNSSHFRTAVPHALRSSITKYVKWKGVEEISISKSQLPITLQEL